MKLNAIIIDPEGYAVLEFESSDDVAEFVSNLVGNITGHAFGSLRTSPSTNRVTLKLSDFLAPVRLPLYSLADQQTSSPIRKALREVIMAIEAGPTSDTRQGMAYSQQFGEAFVAHLREALNPEP